MASVVVGLCLALLTRSRKAHVCQRGWLCHPRVLGAHSDRSGKGRPQAAAAFRVGECMGEGLVWAPAIVQG